MLVIRPVMMIMMMIVTHKANNNNNNNNNNNVTHETSNNSDDNNNNNNNDVRYKTNNNNNNNNNKVSDRIQSTPSYAISLTPILILSSYLYRVFQVTSSIQVFQLKFCKYLSSVQRMLHSLLISLSFISLSP
jgi:hypothetical protein